MLENKIREVVEDSLDRAERRWKLGGVELAMESKDSPIYDSYNAEKSNIPNHPLVGERGVVIDEFIALVADMRSSSTHLDDNDRYLKLSKLESGIQRVYYETSALLPAMALTIKHRGGTVTEFLGDGVLALFAYDGEGINTITQSYKAGKELVCETRDVVNEILKNRYHLPELSIGVGLSRSKAIVNLVGLDREKQAKAFGKCVFTASKLSNGTNEVLIDSSLNNHLRLNSAVRNMYGYGVGVLRHEGDIKYHSLKINRPRRGVLF